MKACNPGSITLAAVLACSAAAANADEAAGYPDHTITMVVPNAPGGGLDLLARIVAPKFAEVLGQSVVVENKSGGDGNVGMQYVTRSKPDGYTVLVEDLAIATNPTLYPDLPFVPLRDLTPISMGVTGANIMVIDPKLPVQSVKEFVEYAKTHHVTYGSGGASTMAHLAGELFSSMAGIQMTHVPYRGGAPAMADLLGGHIDMEFSSPSTSIPHVQAGKLRALAVTTPYRIAAMPDLPTLAESGYPGYEAVNWYCFVAPANTPGPIIDKLNRAIAMALTSPEVKASLAKQGLDAKPGTPAELGAFLKAETDKWAKVLGPAVTAAK